MPPSKKNDPDEDRLITVPLPDYVAHQNFLAQSLTAVQQNASVQMQVATQLFNSANAAMRAVQTNIKHGLSRNGVDERSIPADSFQALHRLLSMDQAVLGGSSGELPVPTFPQMVEPKNKPKKQKKPRDPNAPKKPITAFFLFLQTNREAVGKQMPDSKPGEVQEKMKEMWNNLPADEKEKYRKRYNDNWAHFKEENEEYKAKGGQPVEDVEEPDDPDATPKVDAHAEQEDSGSGSASGNDSDEESEEESEEEEKEPTPPPPPPAKEKKGGKKPSKKDEKGAKEDSPDKKKRKRQGKVVEVTPEPKRRKDSPEPEPGTEKKKKKKPAAKMDEEAKRKKRQSQGFGDDY